MTAASQTNMEVVFRWFVGHIQPEGRLPESGFVFGSPTQVPSTGFTKGTTSWKPFQNKNIEVKPHRPHTLDRCRLKWCCWQQLHKQTWKWCSGDLVATFSLKEDDRNLGLFLDLRVMYPALALKNVTSSWNPFQNKNIEVKTHRFDRYQ